MAQIAPTSAVGDDFFLLIDFTTVSRPFSFLRVACLLLFRSPAAVRTECPLKVELALVCSTKDKDEKALVSTAVTLFLLQFTTRGSSSRRAVLPFHMFFLSSPRRGLKIRDRAPFKRKVQNQGLPFPHVKAY